MSGKRIIDYMPSKIYLGDSVYAQVGSYLGEIILTTENGYPDDPRNRIAISDTELNALIAFREAVDKGWEAYQADAAKKDKPDGE